MKTKNRFRDYKKDAQELDFGEIESDTRNRIIRFNNTPRDRSADFSTVAKTTTSSAKKLSSVPRYACSIPQCAARYRARTSP